MALGRVPIEPANAGYATLRAPVENWNCAATPGRRHQAPNKNRHQMGGQGGSTCDHINGTSTAADGALPQAAVPGLVLAAEVETDAVELATKPEPRMVT